MNQSIFDRIRIIRNQGILNINCRNSNCYRLLVREDDSSDTAYYFSTPIYNKFNEFESISISGKINPLIKYIYKNGNGKPK